MNKFRTLIPPFLIVSKTCRADRHSDPTPNNNPESPPSAWGRFLTIPTTAARTVSQCGAGSAAWGRARRKQDVVSAPPFVSALLGKCGHMPRRGRPLMEKCGHTPVFRCMIALWLRSNPTNDEERPPRCGFRPQIDRRTIRSCRKRRMAEALRPLAFFGFVDHRKSDRTQGRRRVDSNRRRSQRPRPCDPRSPLTRLRRFLTSRTDGSTDCATLRRRERTRALGFAPLENEMWSQRRRSCRRSGEMWSHGPTGAAADGKMWSHFVFLVYGRIPAGCRLGEHA